MRIHFWGVRGSVPWATADGIGHGCNTPCLEVSDETSGATLVLDAGSGIVGLGNRLMGEPRDVTVLLTHYHWDHLQGLPFFAPLYEPGWELRIRGPRLAPQDAGWVDTLFRSPFFPVPADQLPNRPYVQSIDLGDHEINGFEVSCAPLNHPGGALAYRVRGMTGDLVYATDHEFGDPEYDEPLLEFARGAAALVLDSHFTPREIGRHRGWGHSEWRQCAEFAARADAGGLWLFHHKPGRSDQELVRIRTDAKRIFAATDTASEGEALQL